MGDERICGKFSDAFDELNKWGMKRIMKDKYVMSKMEGTANEEEIPLLRY
jgi:hypothetical protein